MSDFATCCHLLQRGPLARPVNGLVIEATGAALPRCALRAPDGRGLRWLLSGGDSAAYGICRPEQCPVAEAQS